MYTTIIVLVMFYIGVFAMTQGIKKKQPILTVWGVITYVLAWGFIIFKFITYIIKLF